uniref:Uncharacterized protein n=1 Tax=Anguilla anguilla TaxID=7936 RepID=A0A0E9XNX4_ANGAN
MTAEKFVQVGDSCGKYFMKAYFVIWAILCRKCFWCSSNVK